VTSVIIGNNELEQKLRLNKNGFSV